MRLEVCFWVRVSEVVNYIPRVVSVELESYRLEFYENFNYLIFSGNTFFAQKIESLRLNFYFVDLES